MHLTYGICHYKEKEYTSYSIAESYREEKIKFFLKFIHQLNQNLQKVKREGSKEVIRDSIKRELARLKITRFFEKPRLSKIKIQGA